MNVITRVDINASASVVREKLLDFSGHTSWNPFFTSISLHDYESDVKGTPIKPGDRLKVTMKDMCSGKVITFTPTVLANTVNKFEWKGSLFGKWFFTGTHTFEFQEKDGDQTCTLLHSERFSGVALPLVKLMLGGTQRNFEAMNIALKEVCEREGECD